MYEDYSSMLNPQDKTGVKVDDDFYGQCRRGYEVL